jgi:hypothetical protein
MKNSEGMTIFIDTNTKENDTNMEGMSVIGKE